LEGLERRRRQAGEEEEEKEAGGEEARRPWKKVEIVVRGARYGFFFSSEKRRLRTDGYDKGFYPSKWHLSSSLQALFLVLSCASRTTVELFS
jgi:hypothetical protein